MKKASKKTPLKKKPTTLKSRKSLAIQKSSRSGKKSAKKATKKSAKAIPRLHYGPSVAKKAYAKKAVSFSHNIGWDHNLKDELSKAFLSFETIRLFSLFLETRFLSHEDKQLLLGLIATASQEDLTSIINVADKQTKFLQALKKGKSTESLIEAKQAGSQMIASFQNDNNGICKTLQLCKFTNLNSHLMSLIKGFDAIINAVAKELVGDSSDLVKWGINVGVATWLKGLMTLKNAKILAVILIGLMMTDLISDQCNCKKRKA